MFDWLKKAFGDSEPERRRRREREPEFRPSPETFLLNFLAARNALFRRHQKELEIFQKEFCEGALIYDKRLNGYEEERILEVVRQGAKADITTTGNTKGTPARLRYELTAVDDTWLVSDLRFECPICHGSGKFRCSGPACDVGNDTGVAAPDTCKVCKGLGWFSTPRELDRLLEG